MKTVKVTFNEDFEVKIAELKRAGWYVGAMNVVLRKQKSLDPPHYELECYPEPVKEKQGSLL